MGEYNEPVTKLREIFQIDRPVLAPSRSAGEHVAQQRSVV